MYLDVFNFRMTTPEWADSVFPLSTYLRDCRPEQTTLWGQANAEVGEIFAGRPSTESPIVMRISAGCRRGLSAASLLCFREFRRWSTHRTAGLSVCASALLCGAPIQIRGGYGESLPIPTMGDLLRHHRLPGSCHLVCADHPYGWCALQARWTFGRRPHCRCSASGFSFSCHRGATEFSKTSRCLR